MLEKKKSLGQHFLRSASYLALIADSAHLTQGEVVVEVGPGDGALTRELLTRGVRVIAIEKDHRLIPLLSETFAPEIATGTLTVYQEDVLEVDMEAVLPQGEYKLVANIPYYITGAIMKKFLSSARQPSCMVLLVQKEVAERVAREKKESILSLSVKVYGTPKYIKTVPSGAFAPPPKVDSAILLVEYISRKNIPQTMMEERFFELLHAGFAQKRKLLVRNLEPVLGTRAREALIAAGVGEKARAEDVPLQTWCMLARL